MSLHSATAEDPSDSTARRRAAQAAIFARMTVLATAGMALILSTPVPLYAQAGNDWIGKRVVQKYRDFSVNTTAESVIRRHFGLES
jgi:hypothetical protein